MKKRAVWTAILLLAALLAGSALAAGGGADDPLLSLAYLKNIFAPKAEQAVQEKIDAAGKTVYAAAETQWRGAVAAAEAAANAEYADVWTEARLKQGDLLSALTGAQVMLLAGEVRVQYDDGAVIDATAGAPLPSGGALVSNHRCLVAEDTVALFTVVSRTAVVSYCGGYRLSRSTDVPDRYAMAEALKTLGLFRGTGAAYGGGFELERAPARVEALVMLIRLLGEEEAALACAAPVVFADIPADYWARAYIAYAVERGYTNGVGGNLFAPDLPTDAVVYVEFLLRALGYSDTAQTDIADAAQRARDAGLLTSGEKAALDAAADFLRADVAYLSWYALETPEARSRLPLHQRLEGLGVFAAADYAAAKTLVTGARL